MAHVTLELRIRHRRMTLAYRAAAVWLFLKARRPDFDEAAAFARISRFYARHMSVECEYVAVR